MKYQVNPMNNLRPYIENLENQAFYAVFHSVKNPAWDQAYYYFLDTILDQRILVLRHLQNDPQLHDPHKNQ